MTYHNQHKEGVPFTNWSHSSHAKTYEFEQHPEYPAVRRIVEVNPYTYRVQATHD